MTHALFLPFSHPLPPSSFQRVLIYRLGSLGDTMVALPALRLIARAAPQAERIVLTVQAPANGVSMAELLAGSGLVHRFIEYRVGERSPGALWTLIQKIRTLRADALVYLTEPRGAATVWRDLLFFRLCGIRRVIGAPLSRDQRHPRRRPGSPLWESEASRLARCIGELGDARLDQQDSWMPFLSSADHEAAEGVLAKSDLRTGIGPGGFLAAAVGVRSPAKDWGEEKWASLINGLATAWPGLGLLLLGGPHDQERAQRLAAQARIYGARIYGAQIHGTQIHGTQMPVHVHCGGAPRVSLALLGRARLLVATDGGLMHAAAGLGVPTVALFPDFGRPGMWFPAGDRHTLFWGRPLVSIGAEEVLEACGHALALPSAALPSARRV